MPGERDESPIGQVLKGALALFGPLLLVYAGYYMMARNSSMQFAQEFFHDLAQEKYQEVYRDRTAPAFREAEPSGRFLRRATAITAELADLRSLPLEGFDAKLLQGIVELRFAGERLGKPIEARLILVRSGTNEWKCARFDAGPKAAD